MWLVVGSDARSLLIVSACEGIFSKECESKERGSIVKGVALRECWHSHSFRL